MRENVLYLTAFITFVTILFGSVGIIYLIYKKVYDQVEKDLKKKFKKAVDNKVKDVLDLTEAKDKGEQVLQYVIANNLNTKMDAKEFMEFRCFLSVREGQEKNAITESKKCCGKHAK